MSKVALKLSEQEWNDVLSAVTFTQRAYPKTGAKNFHACLEKLRLKMWRLQPAFARCQRLRPKRGAK